MFFFSKRSNDLNDLWIDILSIDVNWHVNKTEICQLTVEGFGGYGGYGRYGRHSCLLLRIAFVSY